MKSNDTEKQQRKKAIKEHYFQGTEAPWYEGWDISEEERNIYRNRSKNSHKAKMRSINGEGPKPVHEIYHPRLNPEDLMPKIKKRGLKTLSLFSGCGGLDLGFDLAGFTHLASYDIIPNGIEIIKKNRPRWNLFSGDDGDVRKINWKNYRNKVHVVHGGPPCQPFSMAGRQLGQKDKRDMFPEFVRAVLEISPLAFLAENVPSLGNKRFSEYVKTVILRPLEKEYNVTVFKFSAAECGLPQSRTRLFFVGTKKNEITKDYIKPEATHYYDHFINKKTSNKLQKNLFEKVHPPELKKCLGIREVLGLPDIGYDDLAPTLRSGLTGPRHTTSILSSTAALKKWNRLEIWPNGVALTRERARAFVPKNKHFRLSVPDCAITQGFPDTWVDIDTVYMAIGLIGNAVAPPVAYNVAKSISKVL